MLKRILKGQRGFTLVEMVVVTAIMGVLASVATPLMVNHLAGAKEEGYNADRGILQTSVDAWYTDPSNVRFLGKNQYPLLGRNETDRLDHMVRAASSGPDVDAVGSFDHPVNGDPFDPNDVDHVHKHHKDHGDNGHQHHLHPNHPYWNPLGGIQGADLTKSKSGSPAWTDDGDGVREIKAGSSDTWTTVRVTREGTDYFTDARYYFLDIAALVNGGYLREIPKSASADNASTATGSYTYYLDDKGRVQTVLSSFPRIGAFAEGVYP
jgi:prepilin-type N-terminal cleavage/methylation domain-containing protein